MAYLLRNIKPGEEVGAQMKKVHDHTMSKEEDTFSEGGLGERELSYPTAEEEEEVNEIPRKEKDLFKAYLEQVGRYKLLTAAEEFDLLRKIQEGRKQVRSALRKLPREARGQLQARRRGAFHRSTLAREREEFLAQQVKIQSVPGLTSQRLRSILREIQSGEAVIQEAKEKLMLANLRLVISIANGLRGLGLPLLDLIQEGNLGLMRAIEHFDLNRGYRLSTYATYWIRQGMTRAISDKSRVVRLPVHVTERRHRLTRLALTLAHEKGRKPTYEEVAAHASVSPDKVRALFDVAQDIVSLQTPVGEEGTELGEFFMDSKESSPMERVEYKERGERVSEILHRLTPREEKVIRLRFGIKEEHDHTLEEIGQKLSVTRERVRQIERDAIRKLRRAKLGQQLRALLA
jgi:RNA polymerase primary sigma factor